jgi:hypothetical protein
VLTLELGLPWFWTSGGAVPFDTEAVFLVLTMMRKRNAGQRVISQEADRYETR